MTDPASPDQRNRRRRVTSVDVAREAGVSQALVSRAYSGRGKVTPETRQRIEDAAERLGWYPNALAASVVTGDAPLIGVVTARLNFEWRAKVLSRLLTAFEADGIVPMLFHADTDDKVDKLLREALTWHVRGVVVTGGNVSRPLAEAIHQSDRFLVSFNRPTPHPAAYALGTDNVRGGHKAAELLLGDGRERFVMLAGPEDSWAGSQRRKGFLAETSGSDVWHSADMSVEAGLEAAQRWRELPAGARPDGIFAANDLMAIGFMDGLRSAGIGLDEVSIVGFDDLPASSWAPYRLTSFAQPIDALAQRLLGFIAARRTGPSPVPEGDGGPAAMHLLAPEPVIRATAGGGQ